MRQPILANLAERQLGCFWDFWGKSNTVTGVDPTTQQPAHNRLSAAEDRLARAIARLQTAVEQRSDSTAMSPADAELLAQAQGLQAENAKLRELVDDTAARLDGTIAKFKTKLAGQG